MIFSLAYRLIALITTCISLLTLTLFSVIRNLEAPLPFLIFSNNNALFLRQPSCPTIFFSCADRQQLLLTEMHTFSVAEWSPDGDFIAALKDAGWVIYPAACLLESRTNCSGVILSPPSLDVRVAWGPDGSTLAYVTGDGTTVQIKTRGCWDSSPRHTCLDFEINLGTGGLLVEPTWSGDGRYMAFVSSAWNLYLLDTACLDIPETCSQQIQLISRDPEQENWPSLSRDGSRLLYLSSVSSIQQELFILDIASGERRQLTAGGDQNTTPDWTGDERYVAYTRMNERDKRTYLLDIYALDLQRNITTLLVHNPDRDMYPNWGPSE